MLQPVLRLTALRTCSGCHVYSNSCLHFFSFLQCVHSTSLRWRNTLRKALNCSQWHMQVRNGLMKLSVNAPSVKLLLNSGAISLLLSQLLLSFLTSDAISQDCTAICNNLITPFLSPSNTRASYSTQVLMLETKSHIFSTVVITTIYYTLHLPRLDYAQNSTSVTIFQHTLRNIAAMCVGKHIGGYLQYF